MEKMKRMKSAIHEHIFDNRRVFLRADLNVPITNKVITNDYRLQAILPTIDLLLQKGAKIILATHIGRPKAHDPNFSTELLIPWFKKHGYDIEHVPTMDEAHKKSIEDNDTIVLIENLRFFPGEKTGDPEFVEELERLGDYYVNDAFGVMHRKDASVASLPLLFGPDRRSVGLLVEQELDTLQKIKEGAEQPFVLIIGGSKLKTKLPLVQEMLGTAQTILLCPAVVFTILKAMGKEVGESLVDDTLLPLCREIVRSAHHNKTELIFPVDYQVAEKNFEGPVSTLDEPDIPGGYMGMSIGPRTEKLFADKVNSAKTVFFNGAIGNPERIETLSGMEKLITAMGKSKAFSVVAGGDSVAMTEMFGLNLQMDRCLTGGGAALTFLANKPMPGLEPFLKQEK